MMHFRPRDADWVAVSPFFSTVILNREMPLYYADGVTYGVPWFAESVQKVTIPIPVYLVYHARCIGDRIHLENDFYFCFM